MKNILLSTIVMLISVSFLNAQDAEAKLKELKIELKPIGKPLANYVHVVRF